MSAKTIDIVSRQCKRKHLVGERARFGPDSRTCTFGRLTRLAVERARLVSRSCTFGRLTVERARLVRTLHVWSPESRSLKNAVPVCTRKPSALLWALLVVRLSTCKPQTFFDP